MLADTTAECKHCQESQNSPTPAPTASAASYLRGQILLRMGRKEEAKKEIDTSVQMSSARRDQREKLESGTLPSPELTQEPK